MSYTVNSHHLEAIYRTRYELDNEGNRIVKDNVYVAEHEDFDELQCVNCEEYFETSGMAEHGAACIGIIE